MTWFDYGVLIIIGASVLLGLWRGVVGEILALLAWVLAFLAASEWGADVGQGLYGRQLPDHAWQLVAGCVTVFILILLAMAIVRFALRTLIKAAGLGVADRILGVVFGIARGALIVYLLVAVGGLTNAPHQPWWTEAHTSPPFETAVLLSKPWMPPDLAKRISYR